MLADHRVGSVRKTEFLKTRTSGLLRKIGHFGQRKKAVQDHFFERRALKFSRKSLGQQTRSSGGNCDWGMVERQVREELHLGDTDAVHQG